MGKRNGKRDQRTRADVAAGAPKEVEQPKRGTRGRLARLEKDLSAARKREERRRARLTAASAEVDRIRREIVELVRHAATPAPGEAAIADPAVDNGSVGVADAVGEAADDTAAAPAPSAMRKPAGPRQRRARPATPPTTGPDNG